MSDAAVLLIGRRTYHASNCRRPVRSGPDLENQCPASGYPKAGIDSLIRWAPDDLAGVSTVHHLEPDAICSGPKRRRQWATVLRDEALSVHASANETLHKKKAFLSDFKTGKHKLVSFDNGPMSVQVIVRTLGTRVNGASPPSSG